MAQQRLGRLNRTDETHGETWKKIIENMGIPGEHHENI
jgi:hypothetical protein